MLMSTLQAMVLERYANGSRVLMDGVATTIVRFV